MTVGMDDDAMMMTAEDVMTVVIETIEESTDHETTETEETEIMTVETEATAETTVGTEITETTAEAATDEVAETETLMTVAEVPIKVSRSSAQAMRTDHPLQKERFQSPRESVFVQAGISKLLALKTSQLLRLR